MTEVFDAMAQFEQEHPDLVEALRLFGRTLEHSWRALEAMQPRQIYISDSTTTTRSPIVSTSSSTTVLPGARR